MKTRKARSKIHYWVDPAVDFRLDFLLKIENLLRKSKIHYWVETTGLEPVSGKPGQTISTSLVWFV
jgi:hypothetical protein